VAGAPGVRVGCERLHLVSGPAPQNNITTRRFRPEGAQAAHFCPMLRPNFRATKVAGEVRDFAGRVGKNNQDVPQNRR
jgi:hypothetical protein